MPTITPASKLLLQFRPKDSRFGVTRKTVRKMAQLLGLTETETALFALTRMRDSMLPAYPADEGFLTERQMAAIRKLSPQEGYRPTRSLIEGL